MIRHLCLAAAVLAAPMFVTGCGTTFIPNTDVEDTSQNRKVVTFCEDYRHAVEDRNIGQVLKMTSPRYFEDGGNTNSEDDMDFAGFKDYLTTTFMKTTQIRYEIRYRRITFTENNHVHVDYTYAASWKLPGVKGTEEWRHKVDDNRLDMVQDGDTYKIVAGM